MMKKAIILVASLCLLLGAFIASKTLNKNPVLYKKKEILDYLFANDIFTKVYKNSDSADELDSLVDALDVADTLDELEMIFDRIKYIDISTTVSETV